MVENDEDRNKHIKVSEAELIAADSFLSDDPIGRRLQAAEYILVHFAKETKLKRVKQFIYNMSFDLRQISNIEKFKAIIKDPSSELTKLTDLSLGVAEVRCSEIKDHGTIRFYLFYEPGLTEPEYQFHSQNFGQCIATILSALQFDMSDFQSDKVLKTNVVSTVKNEIKKSNMQVDINKNK